MPEIGGFSLTVGAGLSCPKAGAGGGAAGSSPCAQAAPAVYRLSVRVKMMWPFFIRIPLPLCIEQRTNLRNNDRVSRFQDDILLHTPSLDGFLVVERNFCLLTTILHAQQIDRFEIRKLREPSTR